MTTQECIEALRAAIAALEKQAEPERPKRLAPFPWSRGTGSQSHCLYDKDGIGVLRMFNNSNTLRDNEIIAHILHRSQGENDSANFLPGDGLPRPAVDPAAVRCCAEFWSEASEEMPWVKHISSSLNLPEIRRLAAELATGACGYIRTGGFGTRKLGWSIINALDGKKGD